jgi:ABC-type amino acid transport substrate-binding protein
MPISYQPIYAYARADDKRFDNNLSVANDASVTIVSIDGEMSSMIARQDFSEAKSVQLPQLASFSELFINIAQKKGDITFTDPDTAALYNAQNSHSVRRVPTEFPVRVFSDTLSIARGQDEFRRMIDTATVELLYSGRIEAILKHYEKNPGSFLRAMPGYTVSSLNSRL